MSRPVIFNCTSCEFHFSEQKATKTVEIVPKFLCDLKQESVNFTSVYKPSLLTSLILVQISVLLKSVVSGYFTFNKLFITNPNITLVVFYYVKSINFFFFLRSVVSTLSQLLVLSAVTM